MSKFYCVDWRVFDRGNIKAIVYDVNTPSLPENVRCENNLCEQYRYYFNTYKEAKEFEHKLCEVTDFCKKA